MKCKYCVVVIVDLRNHYNRCFIRSANQPLETFIIFFETLKNGLNQLQPGAAFLNILKTSEHFQVFCSEEV